jgi:NhaP-type Na+/H+ or K+/H+ antiporter
METSHQLLLTLGIILLLGIGGRWLAWVLKIPGILILLGFGCLAGGVSGWIRPDELFGEMLQPMVSLAVGFILFEGGLTLKLSDLRLVWRSVIGLLTVGVAVTWIGSTVAAIYLLEMQVSEALILGAVLTVTGPTVIGPLLQEIRPTGKVGIVAKWEGIVIDPIGATLAVLVFESLESMRLNTDHSAALSAIWGFGTTAIIGLAIGGVAGWLMVECLRRYWVPDYLRNPVAILFVALAFVGSELAQHEAGLVAVTVMGIWLANQKHVDTHSILEFKETLTVLLISCLFIVLAARIELSQLQALGWGGLAFAGAMIFLVRPLSVWLATLGSTLTPSERIFLAWFAPRGIVAAAVSSVFALRMGESGQQIAPATFIVIVSTVMVYGLTAKSLARKLGLAVANPQGILIAGANEVSRAIAVALQKSGIPLLLVDTRYEYVARARSQGLRVHYANILSDYVWEELDLGGIGRLLGTTANDHVNAMAATRFRNMFGDRNVYQLAPRATKHERLAADAIERFHGRTLFSENLNYQEWDHRLRQGWAIRSTKLTASFDYAAWKTTNPEAILLFVVAGTLIKIVALDAKEGLATVGTTVIFLAPPTSAKNSVDQHGAVAAERPDAAEPIKP